MDRTIRAEFATATAALARVAGHWRKYTAVVFTPDRQHLDVLVDIADELELPVAGVETS